MILARSAPSKEAMSSGVKGGGMAESLERRGKGPSMAREDNCSTVPVDGKREANGENVGSCHSYCHHLMLCRQGSTTDIERNQSTRLMLASHCNGETKRWHLSGIATRRQPHKHSNSLYSGFTPSGLLVVIYFASPNNG